MSSGISHTDARILAANFVSGLRTSLLTSLDHQKDEGDAQQRVDNSAPAALSNSLKSHATDFYPRALKNCVQSDISVKRNSCKFNRNSLNSSSAKFHLPLNGKKTNENELFTPSDTQQETCPLSSEEFVPSKLQIYKDDVDDQVQMEDKNVENENIDSNIDNNTNSRIRYGKKCPKCYAINEKDANWCMECGKAIISVEIRRCDSFHEDNFETIQFQRSESQPPMENLTPPTTNSFEENSHLLTSFNNLHLHQIGMQADENESRIDIMDPTFNSRYNFRTMTANFDEYQAHNERSSDRNNAIYTRAVNAVNADKTPELPYFYAFDDLLYPNYAMDDPVMGYVMPSSNIVSNSRTPFCSQNLKFNEKIPNQMHDLKIVERPSSTSSKKHRRWRKKKEKNAILAISPTELDEKKKIENILDEKERRVTSSPDYSSSASSSSSCQLNLPEEIIIHIFSYLSLSKLASCAKVCKQFHRIASDESLWKTIVLKKKHTINDSVLNKIARKHPSSLTITHCNTKNITIEGLRHLFRNCSQSLKVLDVSGSSGGVFVGETVLLHVSSRCHDITSLDVSWSNVGDEGVQSICQASKRLERLSLNGCQALTDDSVKAIAEKHCESLEVFELFGCFNITPVSINAIANKCRQLRILNLGQCHKVSNPSLCSIAKGLSKLESLDIRGCKQIRDASLREIILNCKSLSTLVIANCPSITDSTLYSLAQVCPQLKCLDVCGVGKISDRGVDALARNCRKLETLDLSSTKATGRSVMTISNNCRQALESLKLSFCHSITDACLDAVVRKCKKLKSLHLYGCRPLRNLVKLMEINPVLKIEKESIR